jgi:hypothetical protein
MRNPCLRFDLLTQGLVVESEPLNVGNGEVDLLPQPCILGTERNFPPTGRDINLTDFPGGLHSASPRIRYLLSDLREMAPECGI